MQTIIRRSKQLVNGFKLIQKNNSSLCVSQLFKSQYRQLLYSASKFRFSSQSNPNDDFNQNNSGDNITNININTNDNPDPDNNSNPQNNQDNTYSIKPLQSIPVKNFVDKNLTEEEKKMEQETFLLFSAQQPILPYTQVPCQLRTGTLQDIQNTLAYFLQNDEGEVYMVGLQLESNVQNEFQKQFQKDVQQKTKQDIFGHVLNLDVKTKKMSQRVRITEIQIKDHGIYAKGIPYQDREVQEFEKGFNMQGELEQISSLVKNIRKGMAFEKLDLFDAIKVEQMNFSEMTSDQIDQFLFSILQQSFKLHIRFMKENINTFLQTIIESRSILNRILLIKKHLQNIDNVLEIVNANFKNADDSIIRQHALARARLSIEYIKQNYMQDSDKMLFGGQIFGESSDRKGSQKSVKQKQIEGYYAKLPSIEDLPSREKVQREIVRYEQMDKYSSEFSKVNTYLDEVFSIPWSKYAQPFWDINHARKVLDREIYGLQKVKERILEMIAVNQLKKADEQSKGFVILLYGPPGTGKTSIAKAVAESLRRESRFISFAGVSDPYFIKGHRRTYVDSQPGIFIKEIIKSQTMNPVFIIDEVDKLTKSSMGADPYYSLLEILNPEENMNFTDHYLDIKVDFSKVIFILTANDVLQMLEPLKNRLEMIEIPAYIEEEKLEIGKKYIIPKVIKEHGLNPNLLIYNDQTIKAIIKNWCYNESGVRELKRSFEMICRKFAVELIQKFPGLSDIYNAYLIEQQAQQKRLLEEKQKKLKEQQANQSQQASDKQKENQVNNVNTDSNSNNNTNSNINPNENEVVLNLDGQNLKKSDEQNQDNEKKQQQEKQQYQYKQTPIPIYQTILNQDVINKYSIAKLDLTQPNSFQLIQKYLGSPTYDAEYEDRTKKIFPFGTVNILTVSGFVGHTLTVECCYDYSQPDKKGLITSSGNLKNVLQESLQIAKINAYRYLTKEEIQLASQSNIHVHFMSGALQKDGPSAGCAITTALLSLIKKKSIPSNYAMTGEISLNGEVCKIGGLQSKLIASKTLMINNVIVPHGNLGEVMEFPKQLLEGMNIYFMKEYKQIYEFLFEKKRIQDIRGVITLQDNALKGQNLPFTIQKQQLKIFDNHNITSSNQ